MLQPMDQLQIHLVSAVVDLVAAAEHVVADQNLPLVRSLVSYHTDRDCFLTEAVDQAEVEGEHTHAELVY